jgi:hypothetical protein
MGLAVNRKFFSSLGAALALTACASEPVVVARWSKPGATEAAFLEVRGRCVKTVKAQSAVFFVAGERYPGTYGAGGELVDDIGADFGFESPAPGRGFDADMFNRCMNGHGWHIDTKGYAAPEGDEIALTR